jgi:phosphate/sulfate permease
MSIFSAIGHAFEHAVKDVEHGVGLLAMILAQAAGLGWVFWLPRNRVFPLANAVPGSRP